MEASAEAPTTAPRADMVRAVADTLDVSPMADLLDTPEVNRAAMVDTNRAICPGHALACPNPTSPVKELPHQIRFVICFVTCK